MKREKRSVNCFGTSGKGARFVQTRECSQGREGRDVPVSAVVAVAAFVSATETKQAEQVAKLDWNVASQRQVW